MVELRDWLQQCSNDTLLAPVMPQIREMVAALEAAEKQVGGVEAGATTFVSGGTITVGDGRVVRHEILTARPKEAGDGE